MSETKTNIFPLVYKKYGEAERSGKLIILQIMPLSIPEQENCKLFEQQQNYVEANIKPNHRLK